MAYSVFLFVLETFQKIGDFFKSLLDIDVRGRIRALCKVVDFLFGKDVDQNSIEFKELWNKQRPLGIMIRT